MPHASGLFDYLRPKLGFMAVLATVAVLGAWILPLFVARHYGAIFGDVPEARLLHGIPMLRAIAEATGLGLMPLLWSLPVAIALAGVLLQVALEAIFWVLRLDRADHAWSSFTWTLRSAPAVLLWILIGAALAMAGYWGLDRLAVGGEAMLLSFVLPVAWLLTAPFLAGNAANVTPARPRLFWRPRWPGWFAFLLGLVLSIVLFAVGWYVEAELAEWRGDAAVAYRLLLDEVVRYVGLLLVAYAGFAWLNRRSTWLARGDWPRVWNRASLGALLVAIVRPWGWAVVGLPIIACTIVVIFFVPQVEDSLLGQGQTLSPTWRAFVVSMRAVAQWWWLMLLPLLVWAGFVFNARLFALLGYVEDAPRR
jgi:hypothetical protein